MKKFKRKKYKKTGVFDYFLVVLIAGLIIILPTAIIYIEGQKIEYSNETEARKEEVIKINNENEETSIKITNTIPKENENKETDSQIITVSTNE